MMDFTSFFTESRYPLVDKTYLSWRENLSGQSTGGSFYKATEIVNDVQKFYKLSQCIGTEIVGHESFNEVIVSRLLDILDIPHTQYELINGRIQLNNHEYITQFSVSDNFILPDETEMHLDQLFPNSKDYQSDLLNLNFSKQLNQMLLVDFLIINRDRHSHNISFGYNSNTHQLRWIPLFDHGFYFVSYLLNDWEAIAQFNPMKNSVVNNAIGSHYLFDNLKLISEPVIVHPLLENHARDLVADLDAFVPRSFLQKCLEIIYRRYEYAKNENFLVEES